MSQQTAATLIEHRRDQMFPVLNPKQIAVARRFGGEPRRFGSHETVFHQGQLGVPAYLVLSGSIGVEERDALGYTSAITTHGAGELTGEIESPVESHGQVACAYASRPLASDHGHPPRSPR